MPQGMGSVSPSSAFAYRSSIQESVGFSPFELLFGRKVRGPMEILKAYWAKEKHDDACKNSIPVSD